MTQNFFNQIKDNFQSYEGHEVEFMYFIPSANRYSTAKGYLKKIGSGANENCFIISECGREYAIPYVNVNLVDAMTRTEFIEIMERYVEKLSFERNKLNKQLKKGDTNCLFMISKVGHEISAIENAIKEMKRQ